MYLPRRHARRLLLPPGWVALGFLLLLGCQALLAHKQQLRQYNVMQMTVHPFKPDTAMAQNMGKDYDMPYRSLGELDTARVWQTVDYWGALFIDSDNALHIKIALQAINADTAHEGGVRIRLHKHATYANLIEAWDLMNICNQQKYFLDTRHQPTTIYAITTKAQPVKRLQTNSEYSQTNYLGCCVCPLEEYIVLPPPLSFQQTIGKLWQKDWRLSAVLLAIISALSLYRLTHTRSPTR